MVTKHGNPQPRLRRYARPALAGLAAAALTLSLAACGSGGSKDARGSGSGGTDAVSADLEYVAQQITTGKASPAFTAPGPAFDASAARGKHIFMIPLNTSNTLEMAIDDAMQEVAAKAGIKLTTYTNQGEPSQWVRGMNQAIAEHVDLIILNGAPSPELLQPQIKQAAKAGIPVLLTHDTDASDSLPAGITAAVPAPFTSASRLDADYVIQDSKGKAHVLVLSVSDVIASKGQLAAIKDEFATRCGEGCDVTVVDVPTSRWASDLRGAVQTALQRDPSIEYVLPLFDPMVSSMAPGIRAGGNAKRVKVVTYNGSPSVLAMIGANDIVSMDVGENGDWIGWANMDQAMRMLAGQPALKDEHTPTRVFDGENVSEAGNPPVLGGGFDKSYQAGYLKLWNMQ